MNPALEAYGARLAATPPADLLALRQRHEAVLAAGADVVPDWLALVSRWTLGGVDALAVNGDPALAIGEAVGHSPADPEDVERALAQLGAISELSTVTETLWQRFADFAAPFAGVDVESGLAVSELRWSIEAMSDGELESLLADCDRLVAAADLRGDVRELAAICAGVAETQLAGAVDEVYLIAACLSASDVRANEAQRQTPHSDLQ